MKKNIAFRQKNICDMKKLFFVILVAVLSVGGVQAQNKGFSKVKAVRMVKKIVPPLLDVVQGSLEFVEPSGNRAIDANEECLIRYRVVNNGRGDGVGCRAALAVSGTKDGIQFTQSKSLPTIGVGEEICVEFPVSAGMWTVDGSVDLRLSLDEPNGFGPSPMSMSLPTRAFVAPMLKVVDYSISGTGGNGKLTKRVPFDFQLLLQNVEYGAADDVKVEVELPAGVFVLSGDELTRFSRLGAGEKKSLEYQLVVNNNYSASVIPVKVKISEKHGKFSENRTVELALNQSLSSGKIVVEAKDADRAAIAIASLSSDVDRNIPVAGAEQIRSQKNTFAVIIANEVYRNEADVPFAANDGKVFSDYCLKTFGIPSKNVHLVRNATLNDLRYEVDWITGVMRAYNGDANVIFYYAGHGVPDESNKTAYLLPVDGQGSNFRTGYKLSELYAALGKAPAKSVTVFLDACFSGTKRDGEMLSKNGRGIAIKVRESSVPGNMVVFSAAQGDETAYPYTDKGHGMFTYFLLKKIQQTAGDVSLGELSDYVTSQVSRTSIVNNRKSQTPILNPSSEVIGEWKSWRFIK